LMSLFLGILLLPLLIVVVPYLYNLLNSLIGWLLLFVAVFMILIEERKICSMNIGQQQREEE